ncbi:hypothetical protein D3C77_587450 [compost metagenome]
MPIPVSCTLNFSRMYSDCLSNNVTDIETSPLKVNLTAFPARFRSTCFRRSASQISASGIAESTLNFIASPFSSALDESTSSVSAIHLRISNNSSFNTVLPDSILAKSRISLMMLSNVSPLLRIISKYSCCVVSSSVVSSSKSVIPMTPFIGVRIS